MSNIFKGEKFLPSIIQPWVLAIQSRTTSTLYGLYYIGDKVGGCACQEGFEAVPLDKLCKNGYLIDITSIPASQADALLNYGPSVDPQLSELTISRLNKIITFKDIKEAISNSLTMDKMTSISVDIYVEMWRCLGAKVGRKKLTTIKWQRQLFKGSNDKPN